MALMDSFNRRFKYLRLSVTEACNFRCSYCLPNGYQKTAPHSFLSLEEIKAMAIGMAGLGVKKIRITGGEPTLRKDIIDIIKTLKTIDGIETVAMTSNGYKLEQDAQAYVDAGLDALNISIDSLQADVFAAITQHDKLPSILRGIEAVHRYGLKTIKINTVLMKQWNANAIDQFINFVKDKPYSTRFIELMETGDNAAFFKEQHVDPLSVIEHLQQKGWVEEVRQETGGPARNFRHPNYQGTVGFITPYAKNFCASCNRLRVSAKGGLQLCLFGDQDYNLRPYLLEGETQALQAKICSLMGLKTESHQLHQGYTGKTSHLASIGG